MKDRSNVKGIEKHIRIADSEINAQIDKIMLLPEYKSFNKVINDALFYGLPILCEKLFGKEEAQNEQIADVNVQGENDMEERLDGIEKLLHETILNVTMEDLLDVYSAGESFNDEEQRTIISAVTGQAFFIGSTEQRLSVKIKTGDYLKTLFEEQTAENYKE